MRCQQQILPQSGTPDIWLAFAPVKKTPSDYLVQKASELGVARLVPVFTRRTIVSRVNEERMAANAVEAAEQSERLTVPEIGAPIALEKLLAVWPAERPRSWRPLVPYGGRTPPWPNPAPLKW